MDVFQDALDVNSKKVYQIQALYNTPTTLEFVLQPERDFIFANDIYLNFGIEIGANFIMDNQADKLFDSVEVIVNNEKVSSRSNSNEYFLSSFFQVKSNHPADHFSNVLRPSGWFGSVNLDSDQIIAQSKGETVQERTIHIVNDSDGNLEKRIYKFSMQINKNLLVKK